MTKAEFEIKFNNAYRETLIPYSEESSIRKILKKYSDENGKISSENLAMLALTESIKINGKVLKAVLENVLEFDG